uniref:DUF4142 domain-containing protein n=1 Tax=Globodera rostochiensis TaxID=31243 RepID=A0A914IEL2_GLORO
MNYSINILLTICIIFSCYSPATGAHLSYANLTTDEAAKLTKTLAYLANQSLETKENALKLMATNGSEALKQTVVALLMEEEQTLDKFKKLSDEESANMPPTAKQTVKNAEDILLDRKLTPKEQFEQIAKLDTANSFNEIAKFETLHNITHSKALKLWQSKPY